MTDTTMDDADSDIEIEGKSLFNDFPFGDLHMDGYPPLAQRRRNKHTQNDKRGLCTLLTDLTWDGVCATPKDRQGIIET